MLMRTMLTVAIGVALTLVFLVWTFPYATLEKRLEYEISQRTGMKADLSGLEYAFPFGLHSPSARVELPPGSPLPGIVLDTPRLSVDVLSLMANKLKVHFNCGLLNARVAARATASPVLAVSSFEVQADVQGVQLRDVHLGEVLRTVDELQGICSGHIELAGTMQPLRISGQGNVRLQDSSVTLALAENSLSFTALRGTGHWELTDKDLQLTEGKITGKGVEASLTGRIDLAPDIGASRLHLNGRARVAEANPRAYSMVKGFLGTSEVEYSLRGPLRSPRYSLQ